ncbi:hypothetical protein BS333_15080 [Vibrio azureus]|uniref:Uncharacterized protein n=1 Tax=Vibrio azureus NBRC 104587 TaxID=1219077 RepID=U3ATQ4_9VIBR|nr:hypothetical protein [Vibrio azureus]AUI87726.1 hypothetical protein BS333_15080 [Vibrio azureus]GAD76622.1 hypothetical protein VAZ01S_048_00290 [Vibrio azureus NBRC 104587]
MTIGTIDWPEEPKMAIELYLNFVIRIIKENNLIFPTQFKDPIVITQRYLEESISVEEYKEAVVEWWDYIDTNGFIREFSDRNALVARVAICLLSVTAEDVPELGQHLSWFFELLDKLGINTDCPTNQMYEHFPLK